MDWNQCPKITNKPNCGFGELLRFYSYPAGNCKIYECVIQLVTKSTSMKFSQSFESLDEASSPFTEFIPWQQSGGERSLNASAFSDWDGGRCDGKNNASPVQHRFCLTRLNVPLCKDTNLVEAIIHINATCNPTPVKVAYCGVSLWPL